VSQTEGKGREDNCAILGHHTASSGDFLPTFRYNLSVPSSGFLDPKVGIDRLSQNICTKLPLLAVWCPGRAQRSTAVILCASVA